MDREAVALACHLTTWSGDPRRCRWCDAPLNSRQTSWCSSAHREEFWSNHQWGAARHAAKVRDGHRCTTCGHAPDDCPPVYWFAFLRAVCPRPTAEEWRSAHAADLATSDWWGEWRHGFPEQAWCEAARLRDLAQADYALEVDHRTPILGRHAVNGCHHHLHEYALGLRLIVQVGDEGEDPVAVLLEQPERGVAGGAQDPAHPAGGVVVVHVRDDLSEAATAHGARVPLTVEQRPVGAGLQAVEEPELGRLGGAPAGAEDGAGPGHPLGAAQGAHDGRLGDPPPVSGGAPLRAVEGARSTPGKGRGALEAAIGEGPTVERPGAPEPGVVHEANPGPLVLTDHVRASLDGAWRRRHARIVLGTAVSDMPRPRTGLRTLCHRCHLVATAEQFGRGPRAGWNQEALPLG